MCGVCAFKMSLGALGSLSADPLAVGVIQAATNLGIRVPDELLAVGYDDNQIASRLQHPGLHGEPAPVPHG